MLLHIVMDHDVFLNSKCDLNVKFVNYLRAHLAECELLKNPSGFKVNIMIRITKVKRRRRIRKIRRRRKTKKGNERMNLTKSNHQGKNQLEKS